MVYRNLGKQGFQLLSLLLSLLTFITSAVHVRASDISEMPSEIVEVPLEVLTKLQSEVEYLRQRDAQHQEWEEQFSNSIWSSESSLLTECSCEEGIPRICHCYCDGCTPCQCPTPQAPCVDCPRVSTLSPYFNVNVFGTLTMDMLFNERRPISPGTPYFLAPGPVAGRNQNTFDMHARQSSLGAALTGPQLGCWQTGGQVLGIFYNDNVLADKYGFLPMQAYGEIRNENWRFAAGLQFDVFNPIVPTMLPFSALSASGNSGNAFRGQVRAERFIRPSENVQWTLQSALSEPIPTTIDPTFRISEDNGWPNVESRIALGLGPVQGSGALAARPFEIGFSGIVGQIRTTPAPPDAQVVADVWGVGSDLRLRVSDMFGFAAEFYSGQGLGTYNGAILQTVNDVTFRSIRSTGGWIDTYVYLTPYLHNHWGFGIDDPVDGDVSATLGRVRNETYFTNLLWDVNQTLRIGFEFTWRETAYLGLPDNKGAGYHFQTRWAF